MLTLCSNACAENFAARISPPNFELKAQPGERLRHVVHIQNSDDSSAEYVIRTADWSLSDSGGVLIRAEEDGLGRDSCRPWSRIERPRLKLAPQQTKKYRFEVTVPDDAGAGECRFAVLIAPAPENLEVTKLGNLSIPVAGQIAVIIYVVVGDAEPALEFRGAHYRRNADGGAQATLEFHNAGAAHGRPFGSVTVTDGQGRSEELVVVPFPILPGKSVHIGLQKLPGSSNEPPPPLSLEPPAEISGLIEWDGGELRLKDTPLR